MLGFGQLAKSAKDLLQGFIDLSGGLDSLLGKSKAVPEIQVPGGSAASSATEVIGPSKVDTSGMAQGEMPDLAKIIGKGAELEKTLPSIPNPAGAAGVASEVAGSTTEVAGASAATEVLSVASETAAGALTALTGVAIPAGAALAAVTAGLALFKIGLDQAYADIQNLEGYSGELSSANAMADVRSTLMEIRRADKLGPQLAELSDVTSRGQEALYDIGTELMAAFLDYAEEMKPFIEAAIAAAKITAAGIPLFKEQVDLLITLNAPISSLLLGFKSIWEESKDAAKATAEFTKRTAEVLEGEEPPPIDDPFIKEFNDGIKKLFVPPPQPAPAPPGPLPGGIF